MKTIRIFFVIGIVLYILAILYKIIVFQYKQETKILNHKIDSLTSENFIKDIQLMRYQYMVELIAEKHPEAVEEAEYMTE